MAGQFRLVLLLWVLLGATCYGQDLQGVTVVLDPGHGDRACGDTPADPGACAESMHGTAWECVFTWDTSMRLRRQLQARGADVVLTLECPEGNYEPQPWSPDLFPDLEEFGFKTLVDLPEPASPHEALVSRVATANRVYSERPGPVYFLSLHFDSTSPRLAGISFYYPAWPGGGSRFIDIFEHRVRQANRERVDLYNGAEVGLSGPGHYSVLNRSLNPDSYLIELGNLRSQGPDGENPDLWRMRDPEVREEYAALITETLVEHQHTSPEVRTYEPAPATVPGALSRLPKRKIALLGLVVVLLCSLSLAFYKLSADRSPADPKP